MKKLLFILVIASVCHAENPALQNAISSVTTQTSNLQAGLNQLSTDEASLIQRLDLTNANQCPLWVVGIGSTTVPISFVASTSSVTDLQADLTLSSSFTITGATLGPGGTQAGKSVQFSQVGNVWRVLVFGINTTPIGSGTLVDLAISPIATVPKGVYPIGVQNLVASDAGGNSTLLCGTSGAIKR